jgi:thioredoxin-related protein
MPLLLCSRRDVLLRGMLASAGLWAMAGQRAEAATLPVVPSLAQALQQALGQGQPLVVMVSLEGCPFCRVVRDSYLAPLSREQGVPVVQVDMRSVQTIHDPVGRATTHDQLIRDWRVRVAPTVLFLGKGGIELAPRLVGGLLPDFYGAYLHERVAAAQASVRA